MSTAQVHGWMAEFKSAQALRAAVSRLRTAGYTQLEAYSPYPLDGLADAMRPPRANPIARVMLAGALVGGLGTLLLQWYAAVHAYPLNIGGRPLASWPAFIPAALEMTFLFAATFGVVGMLVRARLPQLYHAAFNVERFAAASRDGFFVVVRADDPHGQAHARHLHQILMQAGALAVSEVAA